MKKIIIVLSKMILGLALLSVFAGAIRHVHIDGKRFGALTNSLIAFSKFPALAFTVLTEIVNPERLQNFDPDFESFNYLDYDIFALNASFDSSKWIIRLMNLRNDSTIYEWYLEEENYLKAWRTFSHSEPRFPILLSDTSIVIHNDESNNLFRLDANSEILWHNTEHRFHHSINLGVDGNIWACTSNKVQLTPQDIEYWDNYLTKIDVQNGEVLYHKSLSEILIENDLSYLIHGYANVVPRSGSDPLHLNEIEPVLKNGLYWNEGDLFLSLRHRSMILLYRPSTNKVIRTIQGPFFNQHDIDILTDSTISFFNNNVTSLQNVKDAHPDGNSEYKLLPNLSMNVSAEVLKYNLNDSSFSSLYPEQFVENHIYARTQGTHHILANGDLFVDNTNTGKVYLFSANGTVLKKYFNEPINGRVENAHWVRIYENLDFLN